MQTHSLRIKSYRSWAVNDTATPAAIERLRKLELYEKLKQEGCSQASCLEAIAWSKSTYYRWRHRYQLVGVEGLCSRSHTPRCRRQPQWTRQHEQQVLHLRRRFPLWGRRKLWKVLQREQGFPLSISTVGRIVNQLLRSHRIKPVSFYYGRVKPKQRRVFKHHSKRWTYGMKAKKPGELIQIDHMSIGFNNGITVKEFKASCPVTGMTFTRAYSKATSRNARDFLRYLFAQCPFDILSIQVDGGSEFRDEFETACEQQHIPLFVLPPRKPKWNGCVERANGTTRYEFYPFYQGSTTVSAINKALSDYQHYYNHYRPHDGIGLETPMAYYQQLMHTN